MNWEFFKEKSPFCMGRNEGAGQFFPAAGGTGAAVHRGVLREKLGC